MERVFIRSKAEEQIRAGGCQQMNIGVTGLCRSAGSTFLAAALAFFYHDKGNYLTFTQCLTPSTCNQLLYDAVAMDQRFASRQFHDIYRRIFEGQTVRGLTNMELGINWILPTPWCCENMADLDSDLRSRLIANAKGDICIFDLAAEPAWDAFLMDMDRLVVVVDPMPSRMIRHSSRFSMLKSLELSGTPIQWIVNRAGSGINRRQVRGYLKNNRPIWIPEMDSSLFYADEFACRFPWENKEIRCNLLEAFTKTSQ